MHLLWDSKFLPLLFEQFFLNRFNSQVSLLFSNIIGSKYENGMPCNLFLAESHPRSYIILDRTHTHTQTHTHTHTHTHTQFSWTFGWFSQKSAETFGLRKTLFPSKLYKKAGIYQQYNGWNIILILKRIKGQTQGWGSLIMKLLWSPIY